MALRQAFNDGLPGIARPSSNLDIAIAHDGDPLLATTRNRFKKVAQSN
jgi:diphthamide biosynthesis methyltransferase